MTPQELEDFLRTPTERELLYRDGQSTASPLDRFEIVMVNGHPQQVLQLQGKMNPLTGNKHSRYRAYPAHVHPWVELIYMYSGACTQRVNGIPVTLQQGQMLLLDQNTVHELPVLVENGIRLSSPCHPAENADRTSAAAEFIPLCHGSCKSSRLRKYDLFL